ncbi:MAG: M3 family oligoendopeptidase, partial [Planctomycetes bacterium]|nr:M3 family oligoendopeptidase [Planctomycetota bacterium]
MTVDTLESLPRAFPRTCVPQNLVIREFADVQPLFEKLLAAPLDTREALEKWLLDWSELAGVVEEAGARIYIRSTVDTTSESYRSAFMHWVEHVDPLLKPVTQQLQRKFAASPARKQLDANYAVLERSVLNQLALYRDENIPLQTEIAKLTNRYDEIQGAVTIEFDGRERTPQQMGKLLLEPDRALRERAWRALAQRRLQDADKLDDLYEAQLRLREQVARNAGFADFRAYTFRAYERFDYTPAHCDAYADAVEKVVLPVLARMHEKRRTDMKLDRLRPWDLAADPKGLPPLKP